MGGYEDLEEQVAWWKEQAHKHAEGFKEQRARIAALEAENGGLKKKVDRTRDAFIDFYLELDAVLDTDDAEARVDTRINHNNSFDCDICGSKPCQARDWTEHLMQMAETEADADAALSRDKEARK